LRLQGHFSLIAIALLGGTVLAHGADERPEAIVASLYAAHPNVGSPPGGPGIWTGDMLARWNELAEEEAQRLAGELDFFGEGLTFDFMTGTQEFWFDDLELKTVVETDGEAEVQAVMDNGADAPFEVHYGFVLDAAGNWQISDVWSPGRWYLSELIDETR
jgi:hypothetical protein